MKIYLILPATEKNRITKESNKVPNRKMLRFSVLSLTTIAALTPETHDIVICDENVEPVNFDMETQYDLPV